MVNLETVVATAKFKSMPMAPIPSGEIPNNPFSAYHWRQDARVYQHLKFTVGPGPDGDGDIQGEAGADDNKGQCLKFHSNQSS